MPPFSACSMCNVRTRKMVKDPVTLKLIYVCPICFKGTFQEKKQIEAENRKKNGAAKQAKIKRITCEDKSEGIAKKAVDLETEKKEQMMRPLQSYNLRVIDPPKVHRIPKVTPLLMQTVAVHFMLGPGDYNFRCIQNLPPDHEYKTWERWLTYSYFFNKLLDLLETVFFVLRKKDRQISFLHIFHHMYMLYFSFMYLYYYGYGGHGFFMCFFNVVVHIMMYSYYYQSSLNRDSKGDLWWKKYITIVQLIQFGIVLGHSIYTLKQPDCPSARFSATCAGSISVVFIILFSNFYFHAYIRPKKTKQKNI